MPKKTEDLLNNALGKVRSELNSLREEVREYKEDHVRLQWAWSNPNAFTDAVRSIKPNETGRQAIDKAMKQGKRKK